jgi:hypothetical protein
MGHVRRRLQVRTRSTHAGFEWSTNVHPYTLTALDPPSCLKRRTPTPASSFAASLAAPSDRYASSPRCLTSCRLTPLSPAQLAGFLATLKGLPATYNKDLQESQEPMFDAADTVGKSLRILEGVISTLKARLPAPLKPCATRTDVRRPLRADLP